MCQCPHCDSRFFKTLETRLLTESINKNHGQGTLLLKKRCKRCKLKWFFRKDFPGGRTRQVTYSLWQQGQQLGVGATNMRLFSSQYSRKIARQAERNIDYLDYLSHVQRTQRTPAP